MDPLSITASAITILQLTGSIISVCKSYISDLKDAPRFLQDIVNEIENLQSIVQLLEAPLPGPDAPQGEQYKKSLEILRGPNGPLEACKNSLNSLSRLLDHDQSKRGASRIR